MIFLVMMGRSECFKQNKKGSDVNLRPVLDELPSLMKHKKTQTILLVWVHVQCYLVKKMVPPRLHQYIEKVPMALFYFLVSLPLDNLQILLGVNCLHQERVINWWSYVYIAFCLFSGSTSLDAKSAGFSLYLWNANIFVNKYYSRYSIRNEFL